MFLSKSFVRWATKSRLKSGWKPVRDGGFVHLVMATPGLEQMKILCRQRRFVVAEMSNAKRRSTGLLDRVFPEFEAQFSDPYGKAALAVLKEAPSAYRLKEIHLTRLTHLLWEAH